MPELFLHDELNRIALNLKQAISAVEIQKLSEEYAVLWLILEEWRNEL